MYAIQITHTPGTNTSLNVTYATDGSSSFSTPVITLGTPAGSEQIVSETSITPSDIKSIRVRISGTAGYDFEINDISIVYRIKGAH